MNNRFKLARCNMKLPLNLQFFAEGGDGAGAEGGNGGGSGTGAGTDGGTDGSGGSKAGAGGTDDKPLSFDDFLKGDGNQAEFDRRIQQAIGKATTGLEEKYKVLMDDKVSEAEKLAKMSKDEKAVYEAQKATKALEQREREITKRELMATAKNTLADKKIPTELAEVLVYSDAESCNKSIEVVEKAFSKAVEAAVQERLKGGEAMKKAPGGENALQVQIAEALKQ